MKLFKRHRRTAVAVDAVAEIEAQQAWIEGRRLPDLDGGTRPTAPGAQAFFKLVALGVAMFIGTLVWRWTTAPVKPDTATLSGTPARIENILPGLKLKEDPRPSAEPSVPVPPLAASTPSMPPTGMLLEAVPAVVVDPIAARRLTSGLQAQTDGETRHGNRPDTRPAARAADSGPMSDRLQPMKLTTSRAGMLGDRNMLLTQGAMIDCVQDTRLVTAQAGMITCYAPHDVRSTNGRVVLVDGGTKFVGYQQGVLTQGQPRIGVVWSRLETPEGVVIHLDSPGTGPLGEAGLDGNIDTHFAERFGGAILVSLIGDLGTWASNRGGSDSKSIRFNSTGSAAQDAVSTVLDNSINIPPTLNRNQGGRIGIYVARDLDFSSVYALRPVVQ